MIEFLKEQSWWISLVIAIIAIPMGIYAAETRSIVNKIASFFRKPSTVHTIIITLLITIITMLYMYH